MKRYHLNPNHESKGFIVKLTKAKISLRVNNNLGIEFFNKKNRKPAFFP
jgi:hypothetical protein